ncbi:intraflagellar transport protein 25 homolog [Littorina saxatilis]|uniref:F5/8 type C domain-containing protein n=1 Tax=Littorina saxatilis TaxID=31220 RepID=A0AAN9B9M6_9CAEN
MFDVALASGGAQIALSTSSDDSHPPEHMIDGTDETFWTTTGLYPQEVIVRFQALMSINSVELSSYDVQNIALETSESDSIDSFEPLAEKEVERTDHQLQTVEVSVGERRAQCLRIIINSGYDHFVAVHRLKVNGKALHG